VHFDTDDSLADLLEGIFLRLPRKPLFVIPRLLRPHPFPPRPPCSHRRLLVLFDQVILVALGKEEEEGEEEKTSFGVI
jgi:hypothetical protein